MLKIERLRMQLPAGYEHRATSISQRVGESLAEVQFTANQSIENLSIGPVRVSPQATDQEIAHSVAQQIVSMLRDKNEG